MTWRSNGQCFTAMEEDESDEVGGRDGLENSASLSLLSSPHDTSGN